MANFLSDPYATPTVEPIGASSAGPVSVPAANAAAFGGEIAEGMKDLGSGISQGAALHDQVTADDAVNQFNVRIDHIMRGDPNKTVKGPDGSDIPDTGYLGLKGEDALRQRGVIEQQLNTELTNLAAKAPTEQTRGLILSNGRRALTSAMVDAGNHADKESTAYYSKVTSDTVALATSKLTSQPFDADVDAQVHDDIINAAVKQAYHDQGSSVVEGSAAYDAAKQDGEKLYQKIKIQAVATTRPDVAFDMVKANRGILGLDYETMYDKYKTKSDEHKGNDLADRVQKPLPISSDPKKSFVIGDSIGEGIRAASGAPGNTVVGLTPSRVLNTIHSMKASDFGDGPIIISSGASNDPKNTSTAADQIKAITDLGIPASRIKLMGVGDRDDLKNLNVNGQLSDIAKKTGVTFIGPLDPSNLAADRIHPNNYKSLSSDLFGSANLDELHGAAGSKSRMNGAVTTTELPPPSEAKPASDGTLPSLAIPDSVRSAPGWQKAVEMRKDGGFAEEDLATTLYLESRFGANTGANIPGHRALGPMQFMPATAAKYVKGSPLDPNESYIGAQRLAIDNRQDLNRRLGRDVTGAELYLAHQQGSVGAAALLGHPEMSAVDALTRYAYKGNRALAEQAVRGNIGKNDNPNMSAQDFANKWIVTFNNAKAAIGGGQTMTMPANVSGISGRPSTATIGFAFRDFPLVGTSAFAPKTNIENSALNLGAVQNDISTPVNSSSAPTVAISEPKPYESESPHEDTTSNTAKPIIVTTANDAAALGFKDGANAPTASSSVSAQNIKDNEAEALRRIDESSEPEEIKAIARARVIKNAANQTIEYETNGRKAEQASRLAANSYMTQILQATNKHDTPTLLKLRQDITDDKDLDASTKLNLWSATSNFAGVKTDPPPSPELTMVTKGVADGSINSVNDLLALQAAGKISLGDVKIGHELISAKDSQFGTERAQVINALVARAKDKLVLSQSVIGGRVEIDLEGSPVWSKATLAIQQAVNESARHGINPMEMPLVTDDKAFEAFLNTFQSEKERDIAARDNVLKQSKANTDFAADYKEYRVIKQKDVPPAPEGVDKDAWNEMMRNIPKIMDSRTQTLRVVDPNLFASKITLLLQKPTEANIREFTNYFGTTSGIYSAEEYIRRLGPAAPAKPPENRLYKDMSYGGM